MDMILPPLKLKILLESNPPKSIILVQRLAVGGTRKHSGNCLNSSLGNQALIFPWVAFAILENYDKTSG